MWCEWYKDMYYVNDMNVMNDKYGLNGANDGYSVNDTYDMYYCD